MQEAFLSAFARLMQLEADVFLQDDQEAYTMMLQQLAREQKLHLVPGQEHMVQVQKLLSPSGRSHWQLYDAMFDKQGRSGTFVSDLAQNPTHRNFSGPILRPLTTTSCRFSHSSGVFFSARDLFGAHAWPTNAHYGSRQNLMPFEVSKLGPGEQRKYVGNGMHLACISSFWMWCLCHLVEKSVTENLTTMPLVQSLDSGDSDDDAEPLLRRVSRRTR